MKLGAILVVLTVVPLSFLIWLRAAVSDRLDELEVVPEAVALDVESALFDDRQAVTINLHWSLPPEVSSPAWSGIVTALFAESGDLVRDGDPILAVDAVNRLAVVSDIPMYRPLRWGDKGRDVMILEEFLVRRGLFASTPDESFDSATRLAVAELGVSLGVKASQGIYEPGWLVWIGSASFLVTDVQAKLGFPAPEPGSALLTGLPSLEGITITDQNGQQVDVAGSWILEVLQSDVPVFSGQLTQDAREHLGATVTPGLEQLGGWVRLAEPRQAFVLPATAIVSGADGTTCVYLSMDGSFSPTKVELGRGRLSTVEVTQGLTAGNRVLANPGDVVDEPACL